jgi:2-dehydro-3-deoxyphosphogluconate aldolase/(4S)-4-hydroxy-2-oxoglutarate aldolase
MARFTRIQVALKMAETGMIPVFYHKDADICKKVLKACYDGGVRVFEFTNRGDYAHEVFTELNKYAAKELPEMILGVALLSMQNTSVYIQLGDNLLYSRFLRRYAKVCNRRKISWYQLWSGYRIFKATNGVLNCENIPGSRLATKF